MQNSRDLIKEQDEAFEALLAEQIAHEEEANVVQRRMALANELNSPEPEEGDDDTVVIRIYAPDCCHRRRFRKNPSIEDIYLYLESLGYFNGDLSTFDRSRILETDEDLASLLVKTNGAALYLSQSSSIHRPASRN